MARKKEKERGFQEILKTTGRERHRAKSLPGSTIRTGGRSHGVKHVTSARCGTKEYRPRSFVQTTSDVSSGREGENETHHPQRRDTTSVKRGIHTVTQLRNSQGLPIDEVERTELMRLGKT